MLYDITTGQQIFKGRAEQTGTGDKHEGQEDEVKTPTKRRK